MCGPPAPGQVNLTGLEPFDHDLVGRCDGCHREVGPARPGYLCNDSAGQIKGMVLCASAAILKYHRREDWQYRRNTFHDLLRAGADGGNIIRVRDADAVA